jgi:hypothetical protein
VKEQNVIITPVSTIPISDKTMRELGGKFDRRNCHHREFERFVIQVSMIDWSEWGKPENINEDWELGEI